MIIRRFPGLQRRLSRSLYRYLILALLGPAGTPLEAFGQGAPPLESPHRGGELQGLDEEARALVQRLSVDYASRLASVRRLADEKEQERLDELGALDRRLRAQIGVAEAASSELEAARAELERVDRERLELIGEIGERERAFAAEIAEYRRQVASLAGSPDPRKRAALERYAQGDRQGAFGVLFEIQEAETRAVAAGWRELAALAADMKSRGEKTTEEVIEVYERAQSLDGSHAWGWIELRRLYHEAGRLVESRKAGEEALERSRGAWDRAAAESELGYVLLAEGKVAEARSRFEASYELLLRLSDTAPPESALLQALAFNLNKLGDVAVAQGDLETAEKHFREALEIGQPLAAAEVATAGILMEVSVSLDRLGDLLRSRGRLGEARQRFEQALGLRERLTEARPTDPGNLDSLAVSHFKLGKLDVAQNRLESAFQRFSSSTALRRSLVERDPANAQALLKLTSDLTMLGTVRVEEGRWEAAEGHFEEAQEILDRLAATDPSSAEVAENLAINAFKLGDVHLRQGETGPARTHFETFRDLARHLVEQDPSSIEAQRKLGVSFNSLARVALAEDDSEAALRWFGEALRISELIVERTPTSAEAWESLAIALTTVGGMEGNLPALERALVILKALEKEDRLPQSKAHLIQNVERLIRLRRELEGSIGSNPAPP